MLLLLLRVLQKSGCGRRRRDQASRLLLLQLQLALLLRQSLLLSLFLELQLLLLNLLRLLLSGVGEFIDRMLMLLLLFLLLQLMHARMGSDTDSRDGTRWRRRMHLMIMRMLRRQVRLDVGNDGRRRRRRRRRSGGHFRNDASRFADPIQEVMEELLEVFFVDDEVLCGEGGVSVLLVAVLEVDLVEKVALSLGHVMRHHRVL